MIHHVILPRIREPLFSGAVVSDTHGVVKNIFHFYHSVARSANTPV